jgi:hypothetical protein
VHIDNTLKNPATWEHILSLDLKTPASVERELVSSAAAQDGMLVHYGSHRFSLDFSSEDHNNAARCMELDATQWMSIVGWGNESGDLKKWQLGIATTLASYAAQGWTRTPSQKQAKHGAAIIEVARTAGVLPR